MIFLDPRILGLKALISGKSLSDYDPEKSLHISLSIQEKWRGEEQLHYPNNQPEAVERASDKEHNFKNL